jgi:FkbM family methyltransferase
VGVTNRRNGLRESLRKSRKLMRLLAVREYRRALYLHRVAATIEHEGQPFAESYGTVIDVGANRGQFAVFARHRWPDARLLCFEPIPTPREVLISLASNLGNVEVIPFAIADESGQRVMQVAEADDSSSLRTPSALQLEAFPTAAKVDEVGVDVRCLDDVLDFSDLRPPVLLKIDVQGAELDVLRGASALLKSECELLVECSLVELYEGQALIDETIRFAHERGFRLIGLSPPFRAPDGTPLQSDVLFSRIPPGGRRNTRSRSSTSAPALH